MLIKADTFQSLMGATDNCSGGRFIDTVTFHPDQTILNIIAFIRANTEEAE